MLFGEELKKEMGFFQRVKRRRNVIYLGIGAFVVIAIGVFAVFWANPRTAGLGGIKQTIRMRFPAVKQVSPQVLKEWLASPTNAAPQLLDVREEAEHAISHLPGARRIDPRAKADAVLSEIDTNRPVVVYCSVGYRSSRLASRLVNAGFTNVVNLEGSIFEWANKGYRLEVSNDKPAEKVHPYSPAFARMLKPKYRADAEAIE